MASSSKKYHILAKGAINARPQKFGGKQVDFKLDRAGVQLNVSALARDEDVADVEWAGGTLHRALQHLEDALGFPTAEAPQLDADQVERGVAVEVAGCGVGFDDPGCQRIDQHDRLGATLEEGAISIAIARIWPLGRLLPSRSCDSSLHPCDSSLRPPRTVMTASPRHGNC